MRYGLARPLDESHMRQIAEAHTVYGILRVRLDETLDSLTVDYDGSRLTPQQVDGVLAGLGIPARRAAS